LIEGEPILNASPSRMHQRIAGKVFFALTVRQREIDAPWEASLPLGVRVSEKNRPEPDVLVHPFDPRRPDPRRDRDDVLVVFEVPSPSTEKQDLGWKRKVYGDGASLRLVALKLSEPRTNLRPVRTGATTTGMPFAQRRQ
jgi:Uma2 family endonuclease